MIINGDRVETIAPVRMFPRQWCAKSDGARARRMSPRCIVLHTTGGEGDARQVYRTLRKRGLSIHYVIEHDGTIRQMADPGPVVTYHAEYANGFSIGIEVCSYLHRRGKPPRKGANRPTYRGEIHGRKLKLAHAWPAQAAATIALVDSLCSAFDLPRHVPRDADGQLYTRVMPRAAVRKFRGVLGHFHVTAAKIDPGTDLFDALIALGF